MNNFVVENKAMHYLMQPGDGTVYRFSVEKYPNESLQGGDGYTLNAAYVLEAGVGDGTAYVRFSINMPSGRGIGCVAKDALAEWLRSPSMHLIGYLHGHGCGSVNEYTLVAVLFALTALVPHPKDITEAAGRMLLTQKFLIDQYNKNRHVDDEPETDDSDYVDDEPETNDRDYVDVEPETDDRGYVDDEPETDDSDYVDDEPETDDSDYDDTALSGDK